MARRRLADPPLPGQPVTGFDSGRPIMALLDLAGRRWQLRIMWELRNGPLRFRALQKACGDISPTLVSRRLAELKAARLIETGPEGYSLSRLGQELQESFAPLYEWSKRWSEALAEPVGLSN